MSTISSRAKIAVVSAAILGAALSAVLLGREPSPPRASSKSTEQPVVAVSPPRALVTAPPAPQAQAQPARAPSTSTALRPAVPAPSKRALSFDAPECAHLDLLSVADRAEDTFATVRTGESEPEQVRVGDLLEGGEVVFIGKHPETGAPIVLLEDDATVTCRAVGRSAFASLRRVGQATTRDFAARSMERGDPNRIEKMALEVPPGTSGVRADFESATVQR